MTKPQLVCIKCKYWDMEWYVNTNTPCTVHPKPNACEDCRDYEPKDDRTQIRGFNHTHVWIDDAPRSLSPDMSSSYAEFAEYVRRHFDRFNRS